MTMCKASANLAQGHKTQTFREKCLPILMASRRQSWNPLTDAWVVAMEL